MNLTVAKEKLVGTNEVERGQPTIVICPPPTQHIGNTLGKNCKYMLNILEIHFAKSAHIIGILEIHFAKTANICSTYWKYTLQKLQIYSA